MKIQTGCLGLALLFFALTASAQQVNDPDDMEWVEITPLNSVVSGQNNAQKVLPQFLLFYEPAVEGEEVFDRFKTFMEEYSQMMINKAIPEGNKAVEESIAQMREMMKEHPSMAAEMQEAVKELEAAMGEFSGMADESVTSYSVDPATLLADLKKLAVNKKAYTGYVDIGGGLFSVTEAPRYVPSNGDYFSGVDVPEESRYTWGAIDYSGRSIIDAKYDRFGDVREEDDIIFLYTKENDGSIRSGALGYDGRVRIPFYYDELYDYVSSPTKLACFLKGDKLGFVDFDGKVIQSFDYVEVQRCGAGWIVSKDGHNFGILNYDGQLVVPMKYKSYWGPDDDANPMMERADRRLDVLDAETFKVIRVETVPDY